MWTPLSEDKEMLIYFAACVAQAAAAGVPFDALRKFIAVRTVGNSCNGGVCTQVGSTPAAVLWI